MENLDIIVLTSVLSTLFLVFGVVVYRELKNIDPNETEERGPRADFIRFIGGLFDESSVKKMNPKHSAVLYRQIKRTISDMETDGVYFPKEVKKQLQKKRDEMTCKYSDLPSVMSYLDEDEYYNGHS